MWKYSSLWKFVCVCVHACAHTRIFADSSSQRNTFALPLLAMNFQTPSRPSQEWNLGKKGYVLFLCFHYRLLFSTVLLCGLRVCSPPLNKHTASSFCLFYWNSSQLHGHQGGHSSVCPTAETSKQSSRVWQMLLLDLFHFNTIRN